MTINIFSYVYWPEQFLINELAQDLTQNHQVNVLTGLPNYPKGEIYENYSLKHGPYRQIHNNVNIYRHKMRPRKKGFKNLIINYLTNLVGAVVAQNKLPKAEWAFVFATSPITTAIPAILWAKLNGAKVCIWLQDLWPESVAAVGATKSNSFLEKVLGLVVRWIYKRTDLMLIQSPAFQENLTKYGYRGPVHVVPNWAPEINLSQTQKPAWLAESNGHFTVTFAGNVGKAQAIDTILATARILNPQEHIQFNIVGDGSELEYAKTEAQTHQLKNIRFYGRRAPEDMPGLFKASSALLVSLKKDRIFAQTIPSKVQAYMAAGRTLVGSLDGVGQQVISEAKCGVFAPAENIEALAAAIGQLAQFPSERLQELGDSARRYFCDNYTKDKIVKQITDLLEHYR